MKYALLGLAVCFSTLVHVTDASACGSCVCMAAEAELPGPMLVRAGAPLNVRLLVPGGPAGAVRLELGDGTEVPIDVEMSGDDLGSVWVTARAPLEPFTSYWLRSGEGWSGYRFTTGDGADTTAPMVEGVTLGSDLGNRAAMCGTTVGGGLLVSSYSDDTAIGARVPVQIDLDVAGTNRRVFVAMDAHDRPAAVALGRMVDSTAQDCFGLGQFPEARPSGAYPAVVTVWDWAGNSARVEGLSFEATQVAPSGCPDASATAASCTVAPGRREAPHALFAALIAALGFVLARRRGLTRWHSRQSPAG